MVEIKTKIKKFFTEDIYSKGLALLFAIGLWFVFGIQNPETDKTIRNIPIRVVNTGGTGLNVVNAISQRAEVSLKGKRSVISPMTAADVDAYVDISKIETPGEYKLEVYITSLYDDVIITRKNPETLMVVLDSIKTKEVPVRVTFDNRLPKDYMLDTFTVQPEVITVKGPAAEISQISYAAATVGLNEERSAFTANAGYSYYTKDHEILKMTNVESDTQQIRVDISILKMKELPLSVNLMNNIFGDATINQTIAPQSIRVAGSEAQIDGLTTLVIGNVDVSKIDTEQEFDFEIKLPAGLRSLDNVTTARAKVGVVTPITKIIQVTEFETFLVPAGFQATVLTTELEARLRGSNTTINQVTAENLKFQVDLSKIEAVAGEYEVAAKLIVTGVENVVGVGEYTVRVKLSEAPVIEPPVE